LLLPHVGIGSCTTEAAVLTLERLDPLFQVVGLATSVGGQTFQLLGVLGVALLVDAGSQAGLEILDGVDLVSQTSRILLNCANLRGAMRPAPLRFQRKRADEESLEQEEASRRPTSAKKSPMSPCAGRC
jgi:hypothetical protein